MAHDAPFHGVGVALVTLFDQRGRVDVEATAAHAERLVDTGLRGVLVSGSTGEAPALDRRERAALVEGVRERLPAEVAVIAGTGDVTTAAAVEHTREAVTAGADAVLALSPLRAEDPRRYYSEVRRAADGVPLLAYHFPAMSSPGIDLADLADLDVDGIKDSSGDVDRLVRSLDVGGAVYAGAAMITLYAGAIGCAGVILALANLDPGGCLAAFSGDGAAQRALAESHRDVAGDFPHGLKRALAARFGTPTHARMG